MLIVCGAGEKREKKKREGVLERQTTLNIILNRRIKKTLQT
jgi:hypothetical protein